MTQTEKTQEALSLALQSAERMIKEAERQGEMLNQIIGKAAK